MAAAGALGTGDALTVDLSQAWLLALGSLLWPVFGPRDDGDETLVASLNAIAGPVRRSFKDAVILPALAAVFLALLLRFSPTVDRPSTPLRWD